MAHFVKGNQPFAAAAITLPTFQKIMSYDVKYVGNGKRLLKIAKCLSFKTFGFKNEIL